MTARKKLPSDVIATAIAFGLLGICGVAVTALIAMDTKEYLVAIAFSTLPILAFGVALFCIREAMRLRS